MTTNRFTAERRGRVAALLGRHVEGVREEDAIVEEVCVLIEDELRAAYGRGFRAGARGREGNAEETGDAPRRPGEVRSALRNGKLRPRRSGNSGGA